MSVYSLEMAAAHPVKKERRDRSFMTLFFYCLFVWYVLDYRKFHKP